MVSIRNVEKFFDDHPELWEVKYPILGRADRCKSASGFIPTRALDEIFCGHPTLLALFLQEVSRDPRHIKITTQQPR